ncbi:MULTISPECIES: TRAP transporter large permease [Brevibacillus]|uniref:TRAP C4-dicarboxylate transport system permease DctM n=1 Tax=Brevibacillus borstelensis AK1 TaxID=1300222 RepID=M8DIE8_9BACL|nr:TRAP transporter large permease subunit [Brevibacillus borstelensis]EMT53197.1 TRAP C4-dicarboxylate transport system permease DctM [Brevibacillus borstelensis AK1]KKX55416.1 C4-dicarboxylate ABC transporter permease [Brevibacillus borstelensis cifa_chp40]MCC0563619.1 TRAP transporter large permease subunit [Brevibacillus borstelensis]MCM3469262.1 TRAP transporter large permease subunit [Brevibacillus borstelensis]MCM3558791.1 TRAP transporter large permease subunit [Brevibacillus borstelen
MEWIVFILFFLLLLLRVPVAIALVFSASLALLDSGFNLDVLPQKMFSALNVATLMAIPGFILAGVLMSRGGISKALIDALRAWVGHYSGGLSVVTILACAVFAAISGSSPATAAAIGAIMIPGMVAAGYSKRYSMGLVAAAGTLGILIPPSIPLIVYGTVAEESIGKLFMAGFVPGLFLTLVLVIAAIIYAKVKNFGRLPKASWEERIKLSIRALPAAFLPFLILGTIYMGVATPTEASVVACVYSLIMAVFVYRQISWKDTQAILRETVNTSAMIFFIIAGATVFGLYLTNAQVPQDIAAWIMEGDVNKWTFLIACNILFFIMGMFLEPTSIILITLPIFLPILQLLGIDVIHFAIIMTVNMELGMITPPVGLNLFVVSGITREKLEEVVKGVMPFIALMVLVLVIIIIWPSLSLWLPVQMAN